MSALNLYHGGENPVKEPLTSSPNETRSYDFGPGFYTTTSSDQAKRWVNIRVRQGVYGSGCVSSYVFDIAALTEKGLKVRIFDGPSDEWFDFVMANRHDPNFKHDYDIIKGPVANDNVYETLTLFEDGIITKAEAKLRLKTYVLVDQVTFHSMAALKFLAFVDSEVVR